MNLGIRIRNIQCTEVNVAFFLKKNIYIAFEDYTTFLTHIILAHFIFFG